MISDRRIFELISQACKQNDIPTLAVKLRWSTRMTRSAGYAQYEDNRISLSTKLFERASTEEQETIVVHEACHLIAKAKNSHKSIKAHGPEWKAAMVACGLKPARTHSIDRTGLRRKPTPDAAKTHTLYCIFWDCDHTRAVTERRWEQVRNSKGRSPICEYCKANMVAAAVPQNTDEWEAARALAIDSLEWGEATGLVHEMLLENGYAVELDTVYEWAAALEDAQNQQAMA